MRWITVTTLVFLVAACSGAPAEPPTLPPTTTAAATATATAGVALPVTPAGPRPPPASLSVDGQQQPGGIGTYCWANPTPVPDNTAPGLCLDAVGIPTVPEPLMVPAGPITATFELNGPGEPVEVQLRVQPAAGEAPSNAGWLWWPPNVEARELLALAPSSRPTAVLNLAPGEHVLGLFVRWQGAGDVLYGFLLAAQ